MHNVSFPEKNTQFSVEDQDILFNSLEDQGETLPHGCLSGSCGACKIQILEGKENLKEPSLIEKDTIDAIKTNLKRIHGDDFDDSIEVRLSCRAKVCGDITFKTL